MKLYVAYDLASQGKGIICDMSGTPIKVVPDTLTVSLFVNLNDMGTYSMRHDQEVKFAWFDPADQIRHAMSALFKHNFDVLVSRHDILVRFSYPNSNEVYVQEFPNFAAAVKWFTEHPDPEGV